MWGKQLTHPVCIHVIISPTIKCYEGKGGWHTKLPFKDVCTHVAAEKTRFKT